MEHKNIYNPFFYIHRALKHCAKKPDTKVAVIFFPKAGFDVNNFYDALAKFNGLKGTPQYAKFDVVYCIQGGKIAHIKKARLKNNLAGTRAGL